MQLNKLRLSHKQQALAMLEVSDSPSKSASARCTGPGIEAITKIIANIQKLIHIVSRDCVVKSCQIDVWDNISEYIYIYPMMTSYVNQSPLHKDHPKKKNSWSRAAELPESFDPVELPPSDLTNPRSTGRAWTRPGQGPSGCKIRRTVPLACLGRTAGRTGYAVAGSGVCMGVSGKRDTPPWMNDDEYVAWNKNTNTYQYCILQMPRDFVEVCELASSG